jgi:Polysulfide reductase
MPQATPESGYYGLPILKKPQWKKEIPLYLFCGGAAGAAAILASVGQLTGADERLVRDGRYLAAIAGAVSPALLIADLGMPSRFLNMLRVFKIQSPMSVGSWTLVTFSSSAMAAAFLSAWQRRNSSATPIKILESASHFISTITGAVLLTYTGVLLGATAIPVWNQNARVLPAHFAASGLAAAGALLELRGHQAPALNAIGIATALAETAVGASIELRKNLALKPLKSGRSGWLTRLGGLLAGPVPLVLRLLALGGDKGRSMKLRKIAAASSVAGSLATRFAWTQAGATSATDARLLLDRDADKLAEERAENRARLTESF